MKLYILGLAALTFVGCSTTDESNDGGGSTPVAKKECVSPLGGLLKHGETVTAYKEAISTSCESEVRTCNDGSLSGSFTVKTCSVSTGGGGTTSPGEEAPLHVNSEGQKIGSLKLVSDKSIWVEDLWHGNPGACPSTAALGGTCDANLYQSCKLPDGKKLICQNKKLYKLFGWISERKDRKFIPLQGVKVDIFWFVGCAIGICGPMVPAVETNSNGYFEIYTPELLDTLRIVGKEGYFGLCNGTKPINGGGEAIINKKVGDPMGPYVQYALQAESCKYGTIP